MDLEQIGIPVLIGVIVGVVYSLIPKKSPDQKYKEKQERLKKKKEKRRDVMETIINLHPGIRAANKEITRLNNKALEDMRNDPKAQDFFLRRTKNELLKKTKQRLINIAKKDLGIELDPKMTKLEMVNKIYVKYHNLKGWDWVVKKDFSG